MTTTSSPLLPDVGAEPADGLPAGDLPLAVIPAPIPLAAYLVIDMPLDVHHSSDADPDMALSAAPAPAHDFEFDHEVDDDFDPVFPPAIAPFVDDIPIADHPVVDAPVDAPLLIEDPVVPPFPDPVPVLFDRAPFATHVDPRYADTRNEWIDDDDDYPPFDIPPPRPGEGSSRQPHVPVPPILSSPFPFASQFPTATPPTAPSFTPSNIMPPSSDTGVSETLDPMAIVSDDEIPSERDVYSSDTTSTDDDDFQPFVLPDVGVEPADGLPTEVLPLAVIPAPIPLAAYPVIDMPLDVVSDDDAPAEELPADSPVPDSFESVASASLHTQGVQHHSSYADPDMALSAAPAPAHDFEFDHEDIEFIHLDQPLELPVAPIDPLFDDPTNFDMDFVDPEPVVAPEPVAAPDLALEHDPVHDDAPAIAPFVDDVPVADAPVDVPLLIEDPVVAPFPDPMPVLFDRAPFATHVDPRYADTRNGWIDDDDDYPPFVLPVTPPVAPVSAPTDIPLIPPHTTDAHRTDPPVTFLQDIPPRRPGEGSSRQPPVSTPPMMSSPFPFTSQFPHQEALSRRIQELERAPQPPCHCQTPFAASHPPRPLSPDSVARFWTSEQQVAYLLRVCRALEQDWLHMRHLYYSHFPPPPPTSAYAF
ncbi:vegetative cell wall protein gp1-like [Helianthus annuus]|uniref:vegetative cell wall protein gp1-like n=1 Tax=Helianthus annuus TaxID=4232 RepID=UPI001652F500|nr:vegetative cell wall protein gp1-like [Helianthus annuus]